ncbi:hypothetical protein IID20_05020 [Patescibacteria group bacterium]|nr:hypothetical protein [Patescibacteria group bacterium]
MIRRQEKLLQLIIKEYVRTAQPVSSEYLAKNSHLKVSPATIRNEMVELTTQMYLCQPHTSAGRLPTLKGFEYYIQNLLKKKSLSSAEKTILKQIRKKHLSSRQLSQNRQSREFLMKMMAQQMAALSGELSILAFNDHSFYYTGLSYLLAQPEFGEQDLIYDVSQIVDQLDRIMFDIFDSIGEEPEIMIGEKNPFSSSYSAIFIRCQLPSDRHCTLIGLLGPIRMDYDKNVALINYIQQLINQ